MAVISLREYNREIDSLIDQGKTDDAIQHCKHILKFFPKHVDTYRLLGKSFLESQRFTEAADLFQRVLSVFPDDFISQIGLSIIREDEGNLDAAIWHIERAFEIQPSNAPIRDELRRLYGRRDGVQPPKVRLTRGALIRMYMQGQLYPQAIAEAKAALQEDPKRIDIEILLARLYYLSGNRVDAINICSNIISKLPFCYEANKILAVILPGTSRSDNAKLFQRRIVAIQPYAAYLSKENPGVDQVPDNTVTLEKLDFSTSAQTSSQPDWAQSIGVEIESPVSEQTPEWFSNIHKETEAEVEVDSESDSPLPALEADEIPDWMKDAGWELRDKDEEEPQPYTGFDEEIDEEENTLESLSEAAPGDLPDWLKELSPEEPLESVYEGEEEQEDDEESLTILEEIISRSETKSPAVESKAEGYSQKGLDEEDEISFGNPEEIEEVPDWLKGFADEEEPEDEGMTEETFKTDLPDWFEGFEEKTTPKVEAEKTTTGEKPDWSKEDKSAEMLPGDEIDESGESDITEWLEKFSETDETKENDIPATTMDFEEDLPDWMKTFEAEETDKSVSQSGELTPVKDDVETYELESGKDIPEKEDSPDQILKKIASAESQKETILSDKTDQVTMEEEEALTEEDSELENWLASLDIDQFQKKDKEKPEEKELPDWLKNLNTGQEESEVKESEITSVAGEQKITDFLNQLENGEETAEAEEIQEPIQEENKEEPESISELPEWLKIDEEAREQEDQGEPSTELPTWLGTLNDDEEPLSPEEEKQAEIDVDSGLPEWLGSLDDNEELLPTEEEKQTEKAVDSDLPEWLGTLEDDEESLPLEKEKQAEKEADSDLPTWLGTLNDDEEPLSPEGEKQAEIDVDSGLPEWLGSLDDNEELLPTEEEKQAEIDVDSALPEWLGSLDDDEEPLPSDEEKQAEKAADSDLPEWLGSLDDDEEPLPSDEEKQAEIDVDSALPEWLGSLDDDEEPLLPEGEKELESVAEIDLPEKAKMVDEESEIPETIILEKSDEKSPDSEAQDIITRFGLDKTIEQNDEIDEAIAWLESLSGTQSDESDYQAPLKVDAVASDETSIEEHISDEFLSPKVEETINEIQETSIQETKDDLELEDYLEEIPPRQISQEEMPTDVDIDQALAWLESLAVKQGADEETLITSPETRQETPPEWVEKSSISQKDQDEIIDKDSANDVSPASETIPVSRVEKTGEQDKQNTEDWLKQLAEQQDSIQETLRPGSFKRIKFPPDWVKEEPKEFEEIQETPEEEVSENIELPIIETEEPSTPIILEADQRENELAQFQKQIKNGKDLDKVISELQVALYHAPMDTELWQILGDAYFKAGNLEESLKAYNKAEELLQ